MTTSELSFLLDLMLNHKLPRATKQLITERIKVVEEGLMKPTPTLQPIHPFVQPPSQQLPGVITSLSQQDRTIQQQQAFTPAQPVTEIAQNPVTQAALIARQQMMTGNKQHNIDTTPFKARPFPAPK